MCKAFIFVGKHEIAHRTIESYQLLIGSKCTPKSYNYSKSRTTFVNETTAHFAHKMLQERPPLELSVYNGERLNVHTRLPENIQRLEDEYLKQFRESLNAKLQESNAVIPAHYQH
jgi:hypothetical protein